MSSRNIWKGLGFVAVAVLAFGFFFGGRATALSADTIKSIKTKAALEGVYQCFKGGAYNADWLASSGVKFGFLDKGLDNDTVKLPYGLTDASDNKANCREIMTGFSVQDARGDDDLSKGLIPSSIKNTTENGKIVEFFAGKNEYNDHGMGYVSTQAGNVNPKQDTQQLIFDVNEDKTTCINAKTGLPAEKKFLREGQEATTRLTFPEITQNNDGSWYLGDTYSSSSGINVPEVGLGDLYQYDICGATLTIQECGTKDNVCYEIYANGDSLITIQPEGGSYQNQIDGNGKTFNFQHEFWNPTNGGYNDLNSIFIGAWIRSGVTDDTGKFDDWKLQWPTNGLMMRPVQWLNEHNEIGYNVPIDNFNYMHIGLSEQEVYDLYKYYVTDVYKVPVICDGEENYDLYNDSNSKIINWKKGTACRAYTSYMHAEIQNKDDVYGVDVVSGMWPAHFTKKVTFDDVLAVLGKINLNRVSGADEGGTISTLPGAQNPGSTTGSQDADKCYDGAGVLGWIVCPITSGLTGIGSSLYEWIEEDFLQVRASIFTDSLNGVENVWGTVRNIANIGFIIMFLIVVVSQLTGYGIDNYGIKRILPKLIIGAIVMNLSYVICELMIDASNITGSGLKDLLTSMAPPLRMEVQAHDPSIAQYVITGAGAIAAGGAILLFSLVTTGGIGIILMLLLALLTVVISLVVLFVTLVVRQAGIVICVIIAPIAVLCYLLPNMEKYSKKWLSLMKGLLLVYPLCGLMIGAGNLMGHVFGNLAVDSNGDTQAGFALSAMVVTAIPYLFVPTLLKSSLAAMGNLGAKISGFGSRMRGGASRKIKNSNAMKNSRERAGEVRTRIKAGVDKNGNVKKVGRFGKFIRGGNRGMARARAQYLKNQDTRNREDSLMGLGFTAARVAQEKKANSDEIDNEMVLLKSETNDGADEAAVVKAFDDAMESGNWNKARAAIRLAGRRKDTAAGFTAATLLNDEKEYSQEALSKIAKEISEGETSKNYRAGSPFAFEYASDLNKGTAKGADGEEAKSFADWMANKDNVSNAIQHHIATDQDLMGVQGKNLQQMADLIKAGGMDEYGVNYLRKLSQEAIRKNKENGMQLDYSKAEHIYRLAYGDGEYLDRMDADGIGKLAKTRTGAPVVGQADGNNDGVARANETFSTRTPQIDVSELGDETLLDVATNPGADMDDATRVAAETEYIRRTTSSSDTSATQAPHAQQVRTQVPHIQQVQTRQTSQTQQVPHTQQAQVQHAPHIQQVQTRQTSQTQQVPHTQQVQVQHAPHIQQIQTQQQVQARQKAQKQDQPSQARVVKTTTIDLKSLSNDSLLDIATNPKAGMDDTIRVAAEREYMRRTKASEPPTELPPPNLPPEPPQPAPSQPSQPGNNA